MTACKWTSSTTPRVVSGRHLDECADRWSDDPNGCRGCLPLQHHPLCDVNLGPDFEVGEDEVVMTIFACVGFECWDEHA